MKISDLLQESQQLDELSAADIGKGVGKVAKGIGAVAGGIAGIPGAVKKGFQAGKKTVSGAGDAPQTPAPADQTTTQPATQPADQTQADQTKPADQTTTQPAAEPEEKPAAPAKPAADAGEDVDAIKKELDSLLQTYKSDVAMQNKNWQTVMPRLDTLEKQVADLTSNKSQPAAAPAAEPEAEQPAATPGFLKSATDKIRDKASQTQNSSIRRTGKSITEGLQLFRR